MRIFKNDKESVSEKTKKNFLIMSNNYGSYVPMLFIFLE